MSQEIAKKVNISELDERLNKLDITLGRDLHQNIKGKVSSLRHIILSSVVDGNYDDAIHELRLYEDFNSQLPIFRIQAERYFSHCEELIRAIDSKIKFAESKSITRTQKQDLHAMIRKHFVGLSESLRQIEILENNIKVQDVRSTVWIIRALAVSTILILGSLAFIEARQTIVRPVLALIEIGVQTIVRSLSL